MPSKQHGSFSVAPTEPPRGCPVCKQAVPRVGVKLRAALEVEGDTAVSGEAIEDGKGERGDNRFRDVARRVVEGDQAVGVPGYQHQAPAGTGWGVFGTPDLRVHRSDYQSSRIQFGLQPCRVQFGDYIGSQSVLIPGVFGE